MPRTTAHRTAALATAAVSPLLLGLWAAGPAQAHGAPTNPVSRVFACSPKAEPTRGPRPAGRPSTRAAPLSPRGTTCGWRT